MASTVNSVNSAYTSSIYGNRNVLSGLASGMDTESMIENAVSGIKLKVTGLQQKRTKVEWKQDAYRSIIDKMVNFTQKYTSYASSTNLFSASFFNNAVVNTTSGKYADKISATGKTSSDIQVLGVKQLARAATYTVSGVGGAATSDPIIAGGDLNLAELKELSKVSGSLSINYGGARSFTIDFDELEVYKDANELADAISSKLGEQSMTLTDGSTVKADTRIGVRANYDGMIEFYDKAGAGNSVYISSASGDIKETLNVSPSTQTTEINVGTTALYDDTKTNADYIKTRELSFTLDGVTKKIKIGDFTAAQGANDTEKLVNTLNDKLADAFGKGRIEVSAKASEENPALSSLEFKAQKGSTMAIGNGTALGLVSNNETSYVNTGKKLGEILGDDVWSGLNKIAAEGAVKQIPATKDTAAYYQDSKGNRVAQDEDGKYYQVDAKGNFMHEFVVNDQSVGRFSKDTALESVLTAINSNADAGVKVSFSKTTNQFQFTARESGEASRVEMGEGLAQKLFGADDAAGRVIKEEKGQDAILSMSVNGAVYEDAKRSSNVFDVDGMTLNLKGTFNEDVSIEDAQKDAVTFTSSADTDKIVEVIRDMVNDYNAMVEEIKNAYSTQPARKNNKSTYEPLTDEDMANMSEASIKSYEEKAKQGLLFADRDLSSLYDKLRSAVTPGGADGGVLRSIGIGTSYSNGLTTISLDETALRSALEADPDKVRDAFTKTIEGGSSSNGLMQSLKTTLDTYAGTTGAVKGILINKAGSLRAPNSLRDNSLQKQLDDLDNQIDRWQEKLSDKVDYYTSKFTALEQLIAEMNSQSSALMGLMGTGGSY